MKRARMSEMSIDQLVERFVAIGLEQYKALDRDEIANFNRLFREMEAVRQELKDRAGDQRRALMRLYDHPNMQVRLKAAITTLAIAPAPARRVIQTIADSRHYPQAGDAGMTLVNLDRGIFKPN